MSGSPTIEELHDEARYEMMASVKIHEIRDFVVDQVGEDKNLIPLYAVYQTLLFLSGLFFLTRAVVLAFRGNPVFLEVVAISILLGFTLLVVIHELLHGIALKVAGARTVTFGGSLRKFIFYAEADRFVMGKRRYLAVALTPLLVIQLIAVAGILVWYDAPAVYFFLMLMTIHSFFCAGDIAMSALFYRLPGRKIFTYDLAAEKTCYFFAEKREKAH